MRYIGLSQTELTARESYFRRLLERLGIPIHLFWRDDYPEQLRSLQDNCQRLSQAGRLSVETATTYSCPCGAVEIIDEALKVTRSSKRKVLSVDSNKAPVCLLCKGQLARREGPCLLLTLPNEARGYSVLPEFYAPEINNLQASVTIPLLVSRTLKLGPEVYLFGQKWVLDTDFCWAMLFSSLCAMGYSPKAVVTSNHSLRQLLLSLEISRCLCELPQNLKIVITPFVNFDGGEHREIGPPFAQMEQMLNRFGSVALRLLLASGLKWNRKDVEVETNTLFWALKGLATSSQLPGSSETLPVPIDEVFKAMDGTLADDFVTALRKKLLTTISQYQAFLLRR